jgi:copper chaperone CopZ
VVAAQPPKERREGVRSAEVNLEAKTVTVNHDETVDSTSIVGVIEEAGYQVA